MEFPGDINVFDAVDFETAVPRITGRTTVELLVQARPTGRIADHYRLAMGGSALLEAKPVLSSIFPDPKLDGFLMHQNITLISGKKFKLENVFSLLLRLLPERLLLP